MQPGYVFTILFTIYQGLPITFFRIRCKIWKFTKNPACKGPMAYMIFQKRGNSFWFVKLPWLKISGWASSSGFPVFYTLKVPVEKCGKFQNVQISVFLSLAHTHTHTHTHRHTATFFNSLFFPFSFDFILSSFSSFLLHALGLA